MLPRQSRSTLFPYTTLFRSEDPRYVDLRRNVLAKLERVVPDITIKLAGVGHLFGRAEEETYGEVEYSYGGRVDKSRSTKIGRAHVLTPVTCQSRMPSSA